jgi:hypothetical protein
MRTHVCGVVMADMVEATSDEAAMAMGDLLQFSHSS